MKNATGRREKWMCQYEAEVYRLGKSEPGKIDWSNATYFFLSGFTALEAADRLGAIGPCTCGKC